MAITRIRTMTAGTYSGSWHNTFDGSSGSVDLPLGYSRCEDTVEVPRSTSVDHGLSIERSSILRPGTVSGIGMYGVNIWNGMPHGSQSLPYSHIPLLEVPPSDLEAATKAAARTNPGRPSVSVPIFLAELRDFPGMLWERGLRKASKPRNSVAENNFGWESLFRDVGQMFKYTELINNRVKELKGLQSKSGLKRKREIWSAKSSETSAPISIWSLEGTWAEAYVVSSRKSRLWVSCRWRPTVTRLPRSADEMLSEARRLVFGWRFNPADVWNLLPWSWFVDYFFNVGDYLEATSNSTDWYLESICVMQHDRTEHRYHNYGTPFGPISVIPGVSVYETKLRRLGSLDIVATQPFLSAKQVTTLAGIAANR